MITDSTKSHLVAAAIIIVAIIAITLFGASMPATGVAALSIVINYLLGLFTQTPKQDE